MFRNDFSKDVRKLMVEEMVTQGDLANKMNVTQQNISKTICRTKQSIPKNFAKILEELGYDIEISYIKRK